MTRKPMTNPPSRWVRSQAIVAICSFVGLALVFVLLFWGMGVFD